MAISPTATSRMGSRIRERRLALSIRQAALAASVGISPSYLNLIEHNKRRIGGKLLVDLALALGIDPAALRDGPEAALSEALEDVAADLGPGAEPPELDAIDALAGRFPGWAGALAAQRRRIVALEARVDALRDRMSHDPFLAEAMHEVLSTASAIRSTAAILAEDAALDPQWRARFHRNLNEEAERLASRATALSKHFEADVARRDGPLAAPQDSVDLLFDLAGHHFPKIEAAGRAGIAAVLADVPDFAEPGPRAVAEAALGAYAADAARLPLKPFTAAAAAVDFAPEPLFAQAGGDAALVLRRLASLPPASGAPEFGLAICDAAGTILRRRRLGGFTPPRYGPGCPRLPLYRAFARPLSPTVSLIKLADGARARAWAVAQPVATTETGQPVLHATMLVRAVPAGDEPAELVGLDCPDY
ncbi:MAG: helix-turn-helix domain-containing protein [Pseudomonadota bacterium]